MQKNILEYLFNIAEKKPNSIALIGENSSLTFSELKVLSFKIGTQIIERNIKKQAVLVFMRTSPEEVATVFGVIAAGCYYVPLDEEMSDDRIKLIMQNVQSPLIIVDEFTQNRAKSIINNIEILLYSNIIESHINESAIMDIYNNSIDIDPIYIVFTSGSTGVPKGVTGCHRSVIDYVDPISKALNFSEKTIFGSQSPLCFDACLGELYPTLKYGGTTCLIPKKLFAQPYALIEFLNEHKVNTILWVASALTIVSAFGTLDKIIPQYLTTIAFGSEIFRIDQLKKWKKALPNATFINLYGPTESTGWCCYYKLPNDIPDNQSIPIGKPFENRQVLLLNDNKLAAPGEEGEICLRGTAVTLGYYNDLERTKQVFVQNPLNTAYPEIIYRTGDIGKIDDNGNLIFISRRDYQIKHMGYRIELGEIELVAAQINGVIMNSCIYNQKDDKIILFYTGEISEMLLLAELKKKLSKYMIPAKIIHLNQFPFTTSGKLDKIALQHIYDKGE